MPDGSNWNIRIWLKDGDDPWVVKRTVAISIPND